MYKILQEYKVIHFEHKTWKHIGMNQSLKLTNSWQSNTWISKFISLQCLFFIEILTYRNTKIKWVGGHIPPIKEMEWGTGIWLNTGADGNFPHFTYEQCVRCKVLFPHLLPPSTFSTQSVLQYDHFVPRSTMN